MRAQLFLLTLSSLLLSSSAVGKPPSLDQNDPKKVKSALVQVHHQIQKLEKNLYQGQHQEKILQQQLAAWDQEISTHATQLQQLEEKAKQHRDALAHTQAETRKLKISQKAHESSLIRLVRATYQQSHREKLKRLLEPHQHISVARLNDYYRFVSAASLKEIHRLETHLNKIQIMEQQISEQQETVTSLTQKVKTTQAELEIKKAQRQSVLEKLSREMSQAEKQLSSLQQREQQLETLFKTLQAKLASSTTYVAPNQDLTGMKQKLIWPISGLTHMPAASSRGKKLVFPAKTGTPVHAVFSGRVVFSEWLRGIGLLIILDHGNGYMSLYGNNQKLYKGLGDWVDQGETIAQVGQSGGHPEPGLYFEIRKNGEALDPALWFKRA